MKDNELIVYRAENKYFDKLYPHIEKEFPPEERKSLAHYKHLLENTPYELILLCRKNFGDNNLGENHLNDINSNNDNLSENRLINKNLDHNANISNKDNLCRYYNQTIFDDDNNQIIGFSLVYLLEDMHILWGDYLAILDGYKNKGYGSFVYNSLTSLFESDNYKIRGMFFEVETPSGDPMQQRRINLYERLGAKRILDNYILPTPYDGLNMYFYYMPFYSHKLNADTIKNSIRTVHNSIHFDIKHLDSLYNQYSESIKTIDFKL